MWLHKRGSSERSVLEACCWSSADIWRHTFRPKRLFITSNLEVRHGMRKGEVSHSSCQRVWNWPPMRRSKDRRIEKKKRDVCSQAVYCVLMAELIGTSGVHCGLQKHPKRAKCHCRWFESILCGGVCVWQCCTSTDGSRQFSFWQHILNPVAV